MDLWGYGFSSGRVWMWELDCEESWVTELNWTDGAIADQSVSFQRTEVFRFLLLSSCENVTSRFCLWPRGWRSGPDAQADEAQIPPAGRQRPPVYLQTARLAGRKGALAIGKQILCLMRILSLNQELKTGYRCLYSLCFIVVTFPAFVSSASLSQENQRNLVRKWKSLQSSPWLGSSPRVRL